MPNKVIPEFWLYDPTITALRRDARLFLFNLALATDTHWRFGVGPCPQEPRLLRSTLYPLDTDIRIAEISRWLQDCKQAGILLLSDSPRGWYVEIREEWRYRREDYAEHQPKYGPRHAKPAEQSQLPLGPMEVAQPAARKSRKPKIQMNESRVGEEVDTESSGAPHPQEIRLLSQGKDSDRFARDVDDVRDDVWIALVKAVGLVEMTKNGAMWEKRLKLSRGALANAVGDWLAKTPDQRGGINPAAWITTAFETEKRRSA